MAENGDDFRELVAEVAAAYFSNSHVPPSEIPSVVRQIAESLAAVNSPGQPAEVPAAGPEPRKTSAAQIRKSITPDGLISFEDNKPYKTLKRHLAGRGLTPQQYREKWGLAADYPMVAPNYSAARSQMAKTIGLGQKGRGRGAASSPPKPKGGPRGRGKPAAGA